MLERHWQLLELWNRNTLFMTKKNTLIIDKIGMCTSLGGVFHCLAVSMLLILGLELLLLILNQEWIAPGIILIVPIIGISAFDSGFLRRRQHFVPALFMAGKSTTINLFLNFMDTSEGQATIWSLDVTQYVKKTKQLLSSEK